MPFAQLVIGSPGSGKSTYCDGMHQFMTALNRKVSVVNLDPANDHTSYPPALDVRDLVNLEEIMEQEELGPNGGILYALEELEHNFEWLEEGLKSLGDDYILFDCPGQVELFTHHASLRNIFFRLQKLGYRLIVIHLTDSLVLTKPSTYISSLLLALRAMLQMDLPHLNVLTKIDRLADYDPLPFNLDYYTEVQDLTYLLPALSAEQPSVGRPPGPFPVDHYEAPPPISKFAKLNEAIVQLIDDFSLVGFETLAVEDKKSMLMLVRAIDRASGYVFGPSEGTNETVWSMAMRSDAVTMDARDVQERWIERRDEIDEMEAREQEEAIREDAKRHLGGLAQTGPSAEEVRRQAGRQDEDDLETMAREFKPGDSGVQVRRSGQK